MLAHYHAQIWNSAELARAFGVAASTVRRYLDTLESALVLDCLLPWHENLSKRQVRAPKVYLRDSGLLHWLLGIRSQEDLEGHPKVGASFEGLALNEVVRHLQVDRRSCFFWATHGGAELDLLVIAGSRRLGFEFKRTQEPRTTRSMHSAIFDLGLDSLDVVYPGELTFELGNRIRALSVLHLEDELEPVGR